MMRHITIDDIHWVGIGVIASAGVLVTHFNWGYTHEWFYVGLGMVLVCAPMVNSLQIHHRVRRMNIDFNAGQRIGYRSGRADALRDMKKKTTRHQGAIRSIARGEDHGGLPATSLRAVAGDRADPRWPAEYED